MAEMVCCARCGKNCENDFDYDEESGDIVCPVCVLEEASCGCADPKGEDE